MKRIHYLLILLIMAGLFSCTQEKYRVTSKTDANGYTYETISNDPMKTRIYTLDNGLKVYLTVNKDEPRVQTLIAVRAGSTSDPVETTGLAHYFEHLMFKGTQNIGTTDWAAEKVVLDEITELFEQHKALDDPEAKLEIYKRIDSLSQVAAGFVATNEYDKLVSSLGAKRTNAGTSYDLTVYMNDIPSNELSKWMTLEGERFGDVVLRLFHTELETVYEEYNMYNDMDRSRASKVLMQNLFKKHPYGRDVIGLPEHLKNPSIKNIYEFYETFYVPNNMAVILAGDFNPDETILLVEEHFGDKEAKELPEITQPVEDPITEPVEVELFGPDAEFMRMAYRFEGTGSEDQKYVDLIDMILNNSKAGLIDLNLNQQQKVLRAGSYGSFMNGYGMHVLYGNPREGQTLEEVKDLLLEQIEKVKNGEFEDWMLEAIVNDMRLSELRREESNAARAFTLLNGFIYGQTRTEQLKYIDELEKITKEELIQFAKENYNDNYVVVYKRFGDKGEVEKVEKPPITPVPINRDLQSDFAEEFMATESEDIKPVFIDFEKEIEKEQISEGVDFYYLKNNTNALFNLNYIIDMGKDHNLKLPIAVNYLPYLGTDKYTAAELQQEYFKLGISMGVSTGNDRSYVYVSGLEKSFDKAIELLEHVLANAKPDQEAYDEYVKGILKKRMDRKKDKSAILWTGMFNYGKYGPFSSTTNILSEEELQNIDPAELTALLNDFNSYEHKVFYYGQNNMSSVLEKVKANHTIGAELKEYPAPVEYTELDTDGNKVYFVDYDMTQANIIFVSKDQLFDKDLIPPAQLFGEYFGGGLSSIVFQEIRESRGLAYSAFAAYSLPSKPDKSNYTYAFVGTQADKLKEATDEMLNLMNDMPKAEKQFELAKESIVKKIDTERIIKANIFWTYLSNMDRGIDYDIRKDVYEQVPGMTLDDLNAFFEEHIKGNNYTFLVLGKKGDVDMKVLGEIGEVKELTLEEIFNY